MKFVLSLLSFLMLSPVLMSGNVRNSSGVEIALIPVVPERTLSIVKESAILYDSMKLGEFGLGEKAFQYAWIGFQTLLEQGKLTNTDVISICDFSQSSRNKRLYVIDLQNMKVLKNTYVAHGMNSGGEFAKFFSNTPKSHKSSLGFYVTGSTYKGQHGLSLKIKGVEKGINDRALARSIVIHGSDYVGERFLQSNPFTGRSFGCPAIPLSERNEIIDAIKDGSCLFIYHPSKLYLTKSKILNG